MEQDFNYYKDLIEKNQLPDGFDQWLMVGENDQTLAHIAVKNKILPPLPPNWTDNTKDWLVKNNDGATIAHLAARKSILPPDWTKNHEDWLIKSKHDFTIGFFYSEKNKNHFNNPINLEDYCQNMINHIYPIVEKGRVFKFYAKNLNNFLNPFLSCIKEKSDKEWIKKSDDYSGYLIDYVESVIDYIKNNLLFDYDIGGDDLILANQIKENIKQTSLYIQDEKIKIKEHLFSRYESKNQSIINENEIDLSRSL